MYIIQTTRAGFTYLWALGQTHQWAPKFIEMLECFSIQYIYYCHTAIENLSDLIGYLLDFTNPYYTALAGNMKTRAKKDNSF